MRFGRFGLWAAACVAALVFLGDVREAAAQNPPPTTGVAGVIIDGGVMRTRFYQDPTGQLTRQRAQAAVATLDRDVAKGSVMRKISLRKLESAIEARLASGQPLTPDMHALAGLQRVQYVFFYPEAGDIVIAGPAEGWMTDLGGRAVGLTTGQPVVELQDLLVALRAYPPGSDQSPVIRCSIDPTPEGLARMQQFLREIGSTATPGDTEFIVNGLRSSLGMQTVSIGGVPADTHFAQVMVEADYRMKLIGIGLEQPPVRMVSYVARANPAQVSRNALARWYFVPDYERVKVNGDRTAMELVGDGVKLVGESEVVSADGQRRQTGSGDQASRAFTTSFTEKYSELAARSPVYAQLRNLIDLSVVAAFIQQHNLASKAGWSMATLLSEEQLPVRTGNAPETVETAVAAVWKGNKLMTPIGGGVRIEAHEALAAANLITDKDGTVDKVRESVDPAEAPADRWWWD